MLHLPDCHYSRGCNDNWGLGSSYGYSYGCSRRDTDISTKRVLDLLDCHYSRGYNHNWNPGSSYGYSEILRRRVLDLPDCHYSGCYNHNWDPDSSYGYSYGCCSRNTAIPRKRVLDLPECHYSRGYNHNCNHNWNQAPVMVVAAGKLTFRGSACWNYRIVNWDLGSGYGYSYGCSRRNTNIPRKRLSMR